MKASDFINSIDNHLYSLIRVSSGDAECRRYLREHLKKQLNKQDMKYRVKYFTEFGIKETILDESKLVEFIKKFSISSIKALIKNNN